jgi:cell division protein FtsI (penicillin-binding protein 3)
VVAVSLLAARLVEIQVVHGTAIRAQSVSARAVDTTLPGVRGNIVDTNGTVLATSVQRYAAAVAPVTAVAGGRGRMIAAADKIGAITGHGGPAVVALIDQALQADPKSRYAIIASDLDVGTFGRLDKLPYPWLTFSKKAVRTYPDGAVAGSLLGFVSADGTATAGLEASENHCLASSDGSETYQRGADGVAIPGTTHIGTKPVDGGTLTLTIDTDLQWSAEQTLSQQSQALGAQFGSVTVAEAKTGKVRALAQWPALDPNNIDATPPQYWGLLPFSTPFEPGSTFKALTASMLIDQGLATPTTHVLAPYRFQSGQGADLHDPAFHATPQPLTLTGVLMLSSNTGISILGRSLSDTTRYEYLRKFGIGNSTAITFPGQSSGILNPVRDWDDQTKYATMFGQGVSTTQMQLVGAYQALANGGVRLPLTVVENCRKPDGSTTTPPRRKPVRVVSAHAATSTLRMLQSVVTGGEDARQLQVAGYHIAAKTGTAQEPDGHGGYLPSYFVSIIGVVPVDDPKYVVSVDLAYLPSSADAAPLFHSIMVDVLKHFRVPPATGPSREFPTTY